MASANHMEVADIMCCASCGTAEVDDTACKSVRYCSVACQREDRAKHKRACKKRMTELRDKILFRQPESSYRGDCPICLSPLPIDPKKCSMQTCCSKNIRFGCFYTNRIRQGSQEQGTCPFCRHPLPKTEAAAGILLMKRVKVNDPLALNQVGARRLLDGDYEGAFEYLTKAVELGDVDAHYQLSVMYHEGNGVEKDEKKELHHLEEAAIAGHPVARHNLGCYEGMNGRMERAVKLSSLLLISDMMIQ